MIQIEYTPNEYKISFSGHAGYAESGKDIVCSAISTLFYTLSYTLNDCSGMTDSFNVNESDEYNVIECTPKKEYESNIEQIFMTILTGIQLVSETYPDYVKFSVKG